MDRDAEEFFFSGDVESCCKMAHGDGQSVAAAGARRAHGVFSGTLQAAELNGDADLALSVPSDKARATRRRRRPTHRQ